MPAFDTHKAVKALRSAGFDDTQAEAVVDQINGAINENVATKTDLEKLPTREELRQEIEKLATKTDLERFVTEQRLREEVAKLATKDDLQQEVAKLELRIETAFEKQASRSLRHFMVLAAAIVGMTKALDLLIG